MDIWDLSREPTSPGEILKEEFLTPLNLTQRKLAEHIGVEVKAINRIVNNKSSITPEMSVKLGCALGISPQFWMNAQIASDLWRVKMSATELPERIAF